MPNQSGSDYYRGLSVLQTNGCVFEEASLDSAVPKVEYEERYVAEWHTIASLAIGRAVDPEKTGLVGPTKGIAEVS